MQHIKEACAQHWQAFTIYDRVGSQSYFAGKHFAAWKIYTSSASCNERHTTHTFEAWAVHSAAGALSIWAFSDPMEGSAAGIEWSGCGTDFRQLVPRERSVRPAEQEVAEIERACWTGRRPTDASRHER